MLRVANALQIADQIGYVEARDYFLQALENELEDWFDRSRASALYYNDTWRTVIPVPSGFGSSAKLNDHHFQYGYFVLSAAIVAKYDAKWRRGSGLHRLRHPRRGQLGPKRYEVPIPSLHGRLRRAFVGQRPRGIRRRNNEESSSEDVNFRQGRSCGAPHRNTAVRDLGIFLYTQEVAAIEQYWWTSIRRSSQRASGITAVAMVWGAGGRYDTWWDPNPIFVHGINVVPASGGSLHGPASGLRRSQLRRGRPAQPWRSLSRGAISCGCTSRWPNPSARLTLFENDRYFTPEFGNSMAMTYHWITNLAALGQLDTRVVADTPTFAVFSKGAKRTHVAFNPPTSRSR